MTNRPLISTCGAVDTAPGARTGPTRGGVDAVSAVCSWIYFSMIASTSRAESTRYSSPLYFTSVPPYLLYSTMSPTSTSSGRRLRRFLEAARAHGEDDALLGLLLGGVRDDQAGGGGLLGVERLDHNAVLERLDGNLGGGRHDPTSPFGDLK